MIDDKRLNNTKEILKCFKECLEDSENWYVNNIELINRKKRTGSFMEVPKKELTNEIVFVAIKMFEERMCMNKR